MPRKKIPAQLPARVHLKNDEWYVGLNFPTGRRDKNNRIIYDQFARRCFPETAERAAELISEIKADYEKQQQSGPTNSKQTLNHFLELFLTAKKKSLSRRTFDFYTIQYEQNIIDSEFGATEINRIKPLDVQHFYDQLKQADKKTPASGDAVRKLHQFLSAAFNQAVRWETLPKNPARGIILPKKEKSRVAALSTAEAKIFLDYCRQSNDYIVFEFGLETGMRPEEYLALTWDDIDFETRGATVNKAVAFNFKGGGIEEKDTKTTGSNRTLIFSASMAERLRIHRDLQNDIIAELKFKVKRPVLLKHMQKKGVLFKRRWTGRATAKQRLENFTKYDLVFPSLIGNPYTRNNLNTKVFKSLLKAAGLNEKKFSLYSLRRTAATLLAAKINPRELADFLGHTDVTTAMKYYVKTTEDSKYKAANALSELLY